MSNYGFTSTYGRKVSSFLPDEEFEQFSIMFSFKMITFCKSVNCPSSQALLALVDGELSAGIAEKIENHLSECEFCSAEMDFYRNYPQGNDPVAAVEIPIPLAELAEALLSNRHKDHSLLNSLLNVDDSLLLKKV